MVINVHVYNTSVQFTTSRAGSEEQNCPMVVLCLLHLLYSLYPSFSSFSFPFPSFHIVFFPLQQIHLISLRSTVSSPMGPDRAWPSRVDKHLLAHSELKVMLLKFSDNHACIAIRMGHAKYWYGVSRKRSTGSGMASSRPGMAYRPTSSPVYTTCGNYYDSFSFSVTISKNTFQPV